jgi:hypothetical protein
VKNLVIYAFYGGMMVIAARFMAATVMLAAAWAAALVRRFFPDVGDPDRMMASHMSVPVTFVLTPADGETPEIFAARARLALASKYPEFEVILAVPFPNPGFMPGLEAALGLARVWMVCRRVLEAPPVHAVHRVPGDQRLIAIEVESSSRGGLLGAAVNFATFPLICIMNGEAAPDALAALMAPFARDPGTCACAMGPLIPGAADRRSGFYWLYNATRICGAAAWLGFQLRAGLPDVSVLLRKDSVIEAGGFGTAGRFEGVLMQILGKARARGINFVLKTTGGSAAHRGGFWLSKEWALGRNASLRLGRTMAALSSIPPLLELGAWAAALSAALLGAVAVQSLAVFLAIACAGGLVFSLMPLFLQEAGFGLHLGWRKLFTALLSSLVESAGPRQAVCAVRAASRIAGAIRRRETH